VGDMAPFATDVTVKDNAAGVVAAALPERSRSLARSLNPAAADLHAEAAMRSRAHLKGHPIHPALIPFPFAFLVGAFVADLAGILLGEPRLWTVGAYLAVAGIATALVAAVPGMIDWRYVLPAGSSGRKRATRHGLLNVSAVVLFAAARWLRGDAAVAPDPPLVGLEGIGVVLLMMGGWMGGTLVYRNQAGVDMRYAGAGKWREKRVEARAGEPVVVARADELEPNQMMLLRVGDRRIVLARTEERYVAFDDHCPHRGGPLVGGSMICGTVQCPWHGSQFDVSTGRPQAGPAEDGIATYRTERAGDEIRLML
jgi:uncharacterized membrane protein/nitrite reductase/ring-hydroxylating ferredoxin subunit